MKRHLPMALWRVWGLRLSAIDGDIEHQFSPQKNPQYVSSCVHLVPQRVFSVFRLPAVSTISSWARHVLAELCHRHQAWIFFRTCLPERSYLKSCHLLLNRMTFIPFWRKLRLFSSLTLVNFLVVWQSRSVPHSWWGDAVAVVCSSDGSDHSRLGVRVGCPRWGRVGKQE